MISSPTRTISVGTTPVSIRKPPLISFNVQTVTAPGGVGASNTLTTTSTATWATGLQVTLSIPAGGTMPTGLTAGRPYYLIVVSATTFKLASSYDNAIAGTAVSVTSTTGSGVVTVTPVTSDPDALPVTYAVIEYPSGGETIQLVDRPTDVYGNGVTVTPTEWNDMDQSLQRYAVASGAGPTSVRITDMRS